MCCPYNLGRCIEDNGNGVCFNVFVYNVQPDITINYADGSSLYRGGETETQKPIQTTRRQTQSKTQTQFQKQTQQNNTESSTYIININTGKFHKSSCSSVKQMNDSNKQAFNGNRDQLIAQGYAPCKKCNP